MFDSKSVPRNVNGNGLKSVGKVIQNSSKSKEFPTGSYGFIPDLVIDKEYSSSEEDEELQFEELELPYLLSPNSKKKLAELMDERCKLLIYSIEVVREELKQKGFEFNETTIKSLGLSLFINIQKYLP